MCGPRQFTVTMPFVLASESLGKCTVCSTLELSEEMGRENGRVIFSVCGGFKLFKLSNTFNRFN